MSLFDSVTDAKSFQSSGAEAAIRNIDPVLVQAVDRYVERLRAHLLDRFRAGEAYYAGKWRTMSVEELMEAREEEWLDWIAYTIMAQLQADEVLKYPRA